MKKYLATLLLLCMACVLITGCKDGEAQQRGAGNPKTQASDVAQKEKIDVDLTTLGSTLVYAEVYSMVNNPDEYFGKTIKMNGPYYASFFDETGLYYHYVIVEDATACCQGGLEFIWTGDHVYPDDYPEEKSSIEVTGVFGSYEELGRTYYYLAVDDIAILE